MPSTKFGFAQNKMTCTVLKMPSASDEKVKILPDLHNRVWILEHACFRAKLGHRAGSMKGLSPPERDTKVQVYSCKQSDKNGNKTNK